MKRNFFILKKLRFLALYNIPHRLLHHMTHHETLLFSEDWTEDLESNWEVDTCVILGAGVSNWHHESRNTSERCRDSKYIFEIECEWIIPFGSYLPCDSRCSGSDDDIYLFERFFEVITDELTNG